MNMGLLKSCLNIKRYILNNHGRAYSALFVSSAHMPSTNRETSYNVLLTFQEVLCFRTIICLCRMENAALGNVSAGPLHYSDISSEDLLWHLIDVFQKKKQTVNCRCCKRKVSASNNKGCLARLYPKAVTKIKQTNKKESYFVDCVVATELLSWVQPVEI